MNMNQSNYYQRQNYFSSMILKGRPVASIEEARAANVDFDGSVSFFPDLANGKIYTKQINMDGTLSFNMYEIAKMPEPLISNNNINFENYITREEFNQAFQQLKETLQPQQQKSNLDVSQF